MSIVQHNVLLLDRYPNASLEQRLFHPQLQMLNIWDFLPSERTCRMYERPETSRQVTVPEKMLYDSAGILSSASGHRLLDLDNLKVMPFPCLGNVCTWESL
jgi:hypothetical protein